MHCGSSLPAFWRSVIPRTRTGCATRSREIVLTVDWDGEKSVWKRLRTAKPPVGRPHPGADEPNPLGGGTDAPATNPFARSFRGTGIALSLEAGGELGLRGQLEFQGARYPVQARANGQRLEGRFEANGDSFPFTAELRGAMLTLESGGRRYQLRAEGAAPVRGAIGGATAAVSPKTLVMKKREFRDPGFGGIVSHTMLVPENWRGNAQVQWIQSASNYLHFIGAFEAPEGHGIRYDYNRSYSFSNSPDINRRNQQNMQFDRNPTVGIAPPPQRQGQVAVERILPAMRPGARNVRLVTVKRFDKLEQQLRERYRQVLQSMQQGMSMNFHCERARVAYEEGGRQWEEDVQYVLTIATVNFRGPILNFDSWYWGVEGVFSARAPQGQLDARLPELNAVAGTLRPTARWSISVNDLRMKISAIKHKGRMDQIRSMGETARRIAATNSQISDSRMRSWRAQQDRSHKIQRAVVNSIHGVNDFRTSDGRTLSFDQNYKNVYEDPAGNLVMSTDPVFDPRQDPNLGTRTWTPVRKVDHFR